MKQTLLLVISVLLSGLSTSPSRSQGALLDGLWTTPSGTVYRLIQVDDRVIATYEVPSKTQVEAGIKQGDLALRGTYVDNVLVGTFYQRAPLEIQAICPEHQIIDGPVQWEFDGTLLTGSLLLVFGSDSQCAITRRALQQMRLERLPGQKLVKHQAVSGGMPVPWPLTW